MKFARYALSAGAAVLLATAADPAAAQKSKDTLRVAGLQPVRVVDAVFDPNPQTNLLDRMVFDTLVYYDVEARKVVPLLAESYTRVDPLTIEYKLRKGVKFHKRHAGDRRRRGVHLRLRQGPQGQLPVSRAPAMGSITRR